MGRAKVHSFWIKRLLFLPLLVTVALGATPRGAWELTDKLKNVPVGDWVKLKYSRGSEHLLLVAAKDDRTITLEELVREEGYRTSWTQIVIDLKKKAPVVIRERTPLGEIRETQIKGGKSNLNEDFYALLTARFWQEPESQRVVVVPAGKFSCKRYQAVFNKKLIRIFFSNKIPLYPVMVVIPHYNLTIRLIAFGKGKESRFLPKASLAPRDAPGKSTLEELSPRQPDTSQAGSDVKTE